MQDWDPYTDCWRRGESIKAIISEYRIGILIFGVLRVLKGQIPSNPPTPPRYFHSLGGEKRMNGTCILFSFC